MHREARRATPIPALIALALLAGCLSDDSAEDPSEAGDLAAGETAAPEGATGGPTGLALPTNGTAPPATTITLWLDAAGALVPTEPPAGATPIPSATEYYTSQGSAQTTWDSAPFALPALIEPAPIAITLFLEAVAPTPGMQTFDDVLVWIGSTETTPVQASARPTTPLAPGGPAQIDLEITFPEGMGPIFIPAGGSIRLVLMVNAATTPVTPVSLLSGPESPSAATVTIRPLVDDPTASPDPAAASEDAFEGTLTANALGIAGAEDAKQHTFLVHPNATRLDIDGAPRSEQFADIDLFLETADGTPVSASFMAAPVEHILLAGPALDAVRGQELTITVFLFYGGNVAYDVVATQR